MPSNNIVFCWNFKDLELAVFFLSNEISSKTGLPNMLYAKYEKSYNLMFLKTAVLIK